MLAHAYSTLYKVHSAGSRYQHCVGGREQENGQSCHFKKAQWDEEVCEGKLWDQPVSALDQQNQVMVFCEAEGS